MMVNGPWVVCAFNKDRPRKVILHWVVSHGRNIWQVCLRCWKKKTQYKPGECDWRISRKYREREREFIHASVIQWYERRKVRQGGEGGWLVLTTWGTLWLIQRFKQMTDCVRMWRACWCMYRGRESERRVKGGGKRKRKGKTENKK